MKKKIILTVFFIISLLPMFFTWISDDGGIEVVKGTDILFNPITIISIVVYLFCLWYKNDKKIFNVLSILSLIAIVSLEIYIFVDWQFKISSGRVISSYMHAGFYLGYWLSILMISAHLRINNKNLNVKIK